MEDAKVINQLLSGFFFSLSVVFTTYVAFTTEEHMALNGRIS